MKPATYIRITDKVTSVSGEQKPVYPSANAEMASNGRCWDTYEKKMKVFNDSFISVSNPEAAKQFLINSWKPLAFKGDTKILPEDGLYPIQGLEFEVRETCSVAYKRLPICEDVSKCLCVHDGTKVKHAIVSLVEPSDKLIMNDQIHPCDCKDYNGGQCYNCLNGAHEFCDKCSTNKNDKNLGLNIVVEPSKEVEKEKRFGRFDVSRKDTIDLSKKLPQDMERLGEKTEWQTINPNLPKYAMSSNLNTKGMNVNWIDLWCEVENWYGDIQKRETAEQLLIRLQKKFKLSTKD